VSQPTTEEHRPPSAGDVTRGRAVLLAAFPVLAAIPVPASGEVVGRAWLAGAGITDTEISGRHVSFFRAGGRLQIEDAGSRNGTWIGGARIAAGVRTGVGDGDVLRLGRTLLVYREAFADEPLAAPDLGRFVGPWGLGQVRARLADLAKRPERNVLVQGETGTGKELVAAAVIRAIGRAKKPHAAINVAGVAAEVFEGQLFGWKKGAYSGAVEDNRGVIREHDGGSLILDEIGELPLGLQPKILRLIENGEILPVGERRPVQVDVALIGATNRPLDAMVEAGGFRRDLLARFLVRIEIPPLRERPEDIFAIVRALWARRGPPLDVNAAEVEAVERLMLASWPANVRDVDRLIASLDPAQPLTLHAVERVSGQPSARTPSTREAAEQALAACGNNQSEAARRLGVSRGMLRRLLGLA
jgi:transcriptional regulator of acetoin/glycerol metabolism